MGMNNGEEFQIPRKFEDIVVVSGRRMRRLGTDIMEIIRRGDHYYAKLDITYAADQVADIATKILSQHYQAAIAALEEYRGRLDRSTINSKIFDKHVEIQHRVCRCGRQGLHDFSYAAISRSGIALIEYTCIFCGRKQSFSFDHS